MIEAVNSGVANATLVRGGADQGQQTRLNSLAASAKSERVQMAMAPFVSPFIQIDTNYNKAVLQVRDSDTGDVLNQFPSETTMRARAAQAEIQRQEVLASSLNVDTQRSAPAPSSNTENVSAASSAPRVAEAQIASSVLASGSASSGMGSASSLNVFA